MNVYDGVWIIIHADLNAAMECILSNAGKGTNVTVDLLSARSQPFCSLAVDEISQESLQELCGMGFDACQAQNALEKCDGNLERAVDWLFNHPASDQVVESNVSNSNSSGTVFSFL